MYSVSEDQSWGPKLSERKVSTKLQRSKRHGPGTRTDRQMEAQLLTPTRMASWFVTCRPRTLSLFDKW
jgi:hypothetical protein